MLLLTPETKNFNTLLDLFDSRVFRNEFAATVKHHKPPLWPEFRTDMPETESDQILVFFCFFSSIIIVKSVHEYKTS